MKKIISACVIMSLCIFAGCGSHENHDDHDHDHDHNHTPAHTHEKHNHDEHDHDGPSASGANSHDEEDEAHNPDEILLSPEKAKAAGVKVTPVEEGSFRGVIKTSGKVLTASGDESTVVAPSAGILSMKRGYTAGMPVGKGAPLFTLSTSKLPEGEVTKRNELAYQQAKGEFERAEKLMADKLITEKDYIAAKTEYERARLAYEATGGKSSPSGVTVSAPTGGYIKECLVNDGDFVEVGQPLMRITQNRKLYLRADLPERDFDKIYSVAGAKFRPSYSDKVYNLDELDGRLVARGQVSGENSSFIPVTFEFNNTGGVMPGCYAEIYLLTGEREKVISIPLTALTEEQGVKFVYVKVDDEGYMKREVKTGASDGERVEIIAGLNPGEDLVTEGAIHVKLASATAAIPAHNHNH